MSQLEEIKARAEDATEGPWNAVASFDNLCTAILAHSGMSRELRVANTFDDADAEFIAHARTDVPKLLAALEAVEELCEQDYMMSPEQIRQAITEALQ